MTGTVSPLKDVVMGIVAALKEKGKRGSLAEVQQELVRLGMLSPVTGRAYTRQNIKNIISKTIEGRQHLTGNHRDRKQIIVNNPDWKNFTQWIMSKFPYIRLVEVSEVSIEDVMHADVYGICPMPTAIYAMTLWMPTVGESLLNSDAPVEVYENGSVELRGYKTIKR